MHRRDYLYSTLGACLSLSTRMLRGNDSATGRIMTVTGPVAPGELGTTLSHEHVMVDFIGADRAGPHRYDRRAVFEAVVPHLKQVRAAGCRTLVECTPAYLARDPLLLKQLSQACGLFVLTNTGYYGAGKGKYLPKHTWNETADELSRRWLVEWQAGIDGSGVRPGFMKIGVDAGRLSDVNRKLVQAAARTHLQSGLTMACHTGDGTAAMEQMEILRAERVDPSAWIWVHAQNERDQRLHEQAATRGGWVEFDGVSPDSIDRHVELASHLRKRGLLGRVLISQDAGWYSVGEPGGGKFREFTTLFEQFLPALRRAGFTDKDIERLTVENPAEAFTIQRRALKH